VDVRDHFSASTSAVQNAFTALETTIGYKVVCNPEWVQIWNELSGNYPDKATFVPN
jgi:hypothetical protein